MYILFALVVSVAVFLLLRRLVSGPSVHGVRFSAIAAVVFILALLLFNVLSRAVGIDVGPGTTASYSIPNDYLSRGPFGGVALVLYLMACLAPAVTLGVSRAMMPKS